MIKQLVDKKNHTLMKLLTFVLLTIMFTSLSYASADYRFDFPWGMSFQEVSNTNPKLIRSYSGLDKFTRTRIARFCEDQILNEQKTRVYYSFKSNRLYEVEYDFIHPTEESLNALIHQLDKDFGNPEQQDHGKLELGELFKERVYYDFIWSANDSLINLRWKRSIFKSGKSIQSLFLTIRHDNQSRKNKRVQLLDDKNARSDANKVEIAFTGLFELGQHLKDAADSVGKAESYIYPFIKIRSKLEQVDFAVGQLSKPVPINKQSPIAWQLGVKLAGFDMLALLDLEQVKLSKQLEATTNRFSKAGIQVLSPANTNDTTQARLSRQIGNINFGFIVYSIEQEILNGNNPERLQKLLKQIETDIQVQKDGQDIVIVMYYWEGIKGGCINSVQRKIAQKSIDFGANLVVGQHPKSVQTIHEYNGGVILYSPGLLLPKADSKKIEVNGLIFIASFNKMSMLGYDLIPVLAKAKGKNAYQAYFPKGQVKRMLIEQMSKLNRSCE